MKDLEKNNTSTGLINNLSFVESRHSDEYNNTRSSSDFTPADNPDHQLKKELKSRQISMISLGGALGT